MGTKNATEPTSAAVGSIRKDLKLSTTLPGTLTIYVGNTEYVTLVLKSIAYKPNQRSLVANVAPPSARAAAVKTTRESGVNCAASDVPLLGTVLC